MMHRWRQAHQQITSYPRTQLHPIVMMAWRTRQANVIKSALIAQSHRNTATVMQDSAVLTLNAMTTLSLGFERLRGEMTALAEGLTGTLGTMSSQFQLLNATLMQSVGIVNSTTSGFTASIFQLSNSLIFGSSIVGSTSAALGANLARLGIQMINTSGVVISTTGTVGRQMASFGSAMISGAGAISSASSAAVGAMGRFAAAMRSVAGAAASSASAAAGAASRAASEARSAASFARNSGASANQAASNARASSSSVRNIQSVQRTINGSFNTGLDTVPFDGFIAETHKGETILNENAADALRDFVNVTQAQQSNGLSPRAANDSSRDDRMDMLIAEVQKLRAENASSSVKASKQRDRQIDTGERQVASVDRLEKKTDRAERSERIANR